MARRLLLSLLVVAAIAAAGFALLVWAGRDAPPPQGVAGRAAPAAPSSAPSPSPSIVTASPPGPAGDASCAASPEMAEAGAANAASLAAADWAVFGRPEQGWAVYAPLVAQEVGASCPPESGGFASALARWQAAHGLPATGRMTPDTLRALNLIWLGRRPFVAATRGGACPPPPSDDLLIAARTDEGFRGKAVRLRAPALDAYRRLVAAARAASPELATDPSLLTIVSAYRGPDEEAARCAAPGSCGTASRARCSAHRTGLAVDLFLGAPPGVSPTSSDDGDRARQSRSAAYRWLVTHAVRFGWVPYPFEPWHWEYTGADLPPTRDAAR